MPKIFPDKCGACGACIVVCQEDALKLVDGEIIYNEEKCVHCGDCVAVCPTGALAPAD